MKKALAQLKQIEPMAFAIVMLLALSAIARAQDPREVQLPAPPPLKVMPRYEREQVNAAKDAKERIRISIELAEGHLLRAEDTANARRHDACM